MPPTYPFLASQWTTAGVWIVALSLVGIFIRQIVPWRTQAAEAEAHLRADLLKRVEKLERQLDRERHRHERDRIHRDAERQLDRHRLNNVTQCFDALLMLLKANPDKAAEIVPMIEDMRAKQLLAEAEEKAIIRAAEIAAEERSAMDEAAEDLLAEKDDER
jgi:hypothetical protein